MSKLINIESIKINKKYPPTSRVAAKCSEEINPEGKWGFFSTVFLSAEHVHC